MSFATEMAQLFLTHPRKLRCMLNCPKNRRITVASYTGHQCYYPGKMYKKQKEKNQHFQDIDHLMQQRLYCYFYLGYPVT